MRRPPRAAPPALALAACLLASAALGAVRLPARPPARLSADQSPADLTSTYGSGGFGRWVVDGFGLPAFRYEVDERTDARARQPELGGKTEAQHQVGNDAIVAAAFNHGYTQLWSQARLAQWANRYDEDHRHYAGGFGYLRAGGRIWSTLALDLPPGAGLEREFGVGYVRKSLRAGDLAVRETTYAPFGDAPLLLDDVAIENLGAAPVEVSWFEYWDVSPFDQTALSPRGVLSPTWDPERQLLTAAQRPGGGDAEPYAIFAAALDAPLGGFETSIDSFFGAGGRAAPDAVVADRLSGSLAPESEDGAQSGALFAFRAPLRLAPGDSVRLRYAYGIARPGDVAALVASARSASDPLAASERAWRDWLPRADFGPDHRWVARELAWDAYLLRSASVFEEACGHHTITQGGYYQYQSGLNLGSRSWLHYLLPIAYTEPALAREILRYAIGLQTETTHELPYGTGPLCTRYDALGTSSDLDFWLLLAAAEYGLATRDTAFFAEALPFYGSTATASAWEHVKLAFEHQESLRGEHVYRSGTNGDWSDFSSAFLEMTESTLVAAQLAYAYPRLADLADRLGDAAFAARLRARGAEVLRSLRGEWTGLGWYSRGYSGERQIGVGAIFGEPQPWAILAGAPSPSQATTLVSNLRRFLGGVSAPPEIHGPARTGSAIVPAANDPLVTERSRFADGVGDNNSNYVGGSWFDVNGWLTWALAELDGTVAGARRDAWSEYTRNTLAAHAHRFPDHWSGTISADDACSAFFSSDPARCGIPLYSDYDGQITEQPTWMVMDAIRLAGITPTRDGLEIAPHLPFATFSLRLPRVGIAAEEGLLRGYVRPSQAGPIELRVALPRERRTGPLETWVDGRVVARRLEGRSVVFRGVARADEPLDWAVTWTRPPR